MSFNRDIDDVFEALGNARRRAKSCALLIGAGCSAKAGIPLAAGFVETIRERWPRAYERARHKTYPQCMAKLPPGERRDQWHGVNENSLPCQLGTHSRRIESTATINPH